MYAGLLDVLFSGLLVLGFPGSLSAPLNLFEFYIVIYAGLSLGQWIVEAWALAHPAGRWVNPEGLRPTRWQRRAYEGPIAPSGLVLLEVEVDSPIYGADHAVGDQRDDSD